MSAQYSHIPLSEPDGESPDTSLTEQLVGPAPGAPTLRSEVVPRLSVVAPATLPEGYEFDTTIGSASYRVKVPPGGVEEGQTFDVPLPSAIIRGTTVSVPVGHWRDSLLGCFSHGPCHPHLWTGLLCGLLAAGQVIRRLKLNALGRPGPVSQTEIAFKIILLVVTVYMTIYIGLYFVLLYLSPPGLGDPTYPGPVAFSDSYMLVAWIRSIWHYIYVIVLTVVLFNLRGYVRRRYAIPGSETMDCCCSFWCPCLVVTQLMRHTTDYEMYPSFCCSETGLPPHAPEIV